MKIQPFDYNGHSVRSKEQEQSEREPRDKRGDQRKQRTQLRAKECLGKNSNFGIKWWDDEKHRFFSTSGKGKKEKKDDF